MDKIIIRNLRCEGILGILPEERMKPQVIVLNVTAFFDTRKAAETQDIAFALDYAALCERLRERVETGSDLLVERLVEELAQITLEMGAERVIMRVEKPSAIEYADAVGVEIERGRRGWGSRE